MSASKEVTLWCDGPDCWLWVQGNWRTVAVARRQVRVDGWVYRNKRDLCPACAEIGDTE